MTVDIQWLATLLGNVRDLDVLLTETLPPIEAAMQGHAKFSAIKKALSMQRKQHRDELCSALRSARFGELLLRLLQWLHEYSEKPAQKKPGLRRYSQRSLQQRWRQVDRLARRWQSLNDEQRHDLRKRAKKLRYAAEFFSPLYQPKAVANYLQALQTTQQILGSMNDCATAQTLLKQLIEQTPVLAPAADLAIGWLACKAQQLDTELERDIKNLETAKIFWRS
jgi:CHAD domain-containing protein